MKLTRTLIAVIAGCGLALAQDRGGVESKAANDSIKTQIKNLDNDSYELRTKAMEDLRAAGETARADLEAARKNPSLEVRTRAETLLKELDSAKQPAARKPTALKPVAPEDERRQDVQIRGPVPKIGDFPDQQAYIEALRKWMNEQMKQDSRFPKFVLPDDKDMDKDVQVIMPDSGAVGGTSMSVTSGGGETRTFKSGPDGVTFTVQRAGEQPETWTAKDLDELKTKNPEVWEKYHPGERESGLTWTIGGGLGRGAPRRGVQVVPVGPGRSEVDLSKLVEEQNQPRLGIFASAVPPILDKQLRLKGEGMVIDSVFPDSLAARMGMQEMDVLIQLDGQVIRDRDDIQRVISKKGAPATATARVVREGAVVELSAPREKGK